MITISNGINVRLVSTGAFETIYKKKGYHIVDGSKPVETKNVKKTKEDVTVKEEPIESKSAESETIEDTESDWVTELLETPISQWSKEETAAFAKEKNIDTSNAHKLSEAKDIIKNWIDKHNR